MKLLYVDCQCIQLKRRQSPGIHDDPQRLGSIHHVIQPFCCSVCFHFYCLLTSTLHFVSSHSGCRPDGWMWTMPIYQSSTGVTSGDWSPSQPSRNPLLRDGRHQQQSFGRCQCTNSRYEESKVLIHSISSDSKPDAKLLLLRWE